MVRRLCILSLVILFLGSVANVWATPIKKLKKHENGFTRSIPKIDKLKLEKFFKNDRKEKRFGSFLEKKSNRPDNPFKILIGKKFEHIGLNNFHNFRCVDKPGNPVPEPSTMLLLGCGLIGLAGWGKKRLKNK